MDQAEPQPTSSLRSQRLGWVVGCVVGTLLMIALGFALNRQTAPAPPATIAGDPVLVRGFGIYTLRCAGCHGDGARGDGRLVAALAGPKPRNLVADDWKYGETAEAALSSIANGCPGSAMPAYKGLYGPTDLKAITAYTLHLAERSVPRALRIP